MPEIYLVVNGQYSDYHVICAFSTEEQAEAFAKNTFGRVQTFPLDVPPQEWWEIEVTMAKDGSLLDYSSPKVTEFSTHDLPRGFQQFTTPKVMTYLVNTQDLDRAVKVTNEVRTQILAMNLWPSENAGLGNLNDASQLVRERLDQAQTP